LGKLLHFVSLVDILPIFYTKKRYRGRLSRIEPGFNGFGKQKSAKSVPKIHCQLPLYKRWL
jgi:hypothetical protein